MLWAVIICKPQLFIWERWLYHPKAMLHKRRSGAEGYLNDSGDLTQTWNASSNLKETRDWSHLVQRGWSHSEIMYCSKCVVAVSEISTEDMGHKVVTWLSCSHLPLSLLLSRLTPGRGSVLRHMSASATQQEMPWHQLPVLLTSYKSCTATRNRLLNPSLCST